jgi:hypothetical protein
MSAMGQQRTNRAAISNSDCPLYDLKNGAVGKTNVGGIDLDQGGVHRVPHRVAL